MNIEITPVSVQEKELLKNLLEKYNYEFSQYDGEDVNALGLYGYDWLDCYWTQEKRYAFFIRVRGNLAGFFLINDYPESGVQTDYCMAEFFVLYKYRRSGVGQSAANWAFGRFPGTWQLKRHPKNIPSVRFWDRVVSEYTGGDYRVRTGFPGTDYADGTPGEFLFFSTQAKSKSGIFVRRAQPEDAERIFELNRDCLGYDFPLEQTRERLVQCLNYSAHFLAVALDDERAVGYVHACEYDCVYAPLLADIRGIAVDPLCRGKGVGKQLLQAVEDWAHQHGCAGVRLVSGYDRTGAHAFYEHCGYGNRKDQKNFKKDFSK